MAKWQVVLCALPLLVAPPAIAFAAEPNDTEVKPNAEELANQAYEAYKKGDYTQALAQYQRAFQISAAAPLLFNIAQIYDRKLHERDLASEYYRRYLRLPDADPELIKRANERLIALKREEEALRDNPPPATQPASGARTGTDAAAPPATADSSPASGNTLRIAGLAVAGLGVVGLAVGTISGLNAKSKNDDAATQCPNNACGSAQGVSLTDDARRAATISSIGFIAGGLLVAGGLTLYFTAPKDQKTAFRLAPSVGFNSAGLTLGREWQ